MNEIIYCRQCKHLDRDAWMCNYHCIGIWNTEFEEDIIYRITVDPNGYCWKAEQKEYINEEDNRTIDSSNSDNCC